jgi:hypothetical protein
MAKAQHISYQELIQAVADASDSDTRYGFFLGAGAEAFALKRWEKISL